MNIAKARAFCTALPGATLDDEWRVEDDVHPVFSVGGRTLAKKGERVADPLSFEVDDARLFEPTDRDGIEPASYVARTKRVMIDRPTRPSDTEPTTPPIEAQAVIVGKRSKKRQAGSLGAMAMATAATIEGRARTNPAAVAS